MRKLIISVGVAGLALAVGLAACNFNVDEDDIDALLEACGGMTLEELITADSISEECRQAINDLLPDDEDNLTGNVIAAGSGEIGGDRVLLVVGTDEGGQPIDLSAADVEVEADGEPVPESSFSVDLAADLDGNIVSSACALDYSASMYDGDIDDAIEVFDALFSIPVGLEADYRIFSDDVLLKTQFTSNNAALLEAIERDDSFPRQSTALFDGMGDGIGAAADRSGLVKLLVVATDGGENASTTFTDEDQLFQLAKQNDVHIVVAGSLLSDLDFMKRAASETDGFYFYSKAFGSLKSLVQDLIDALTEMGAIVITDPDFQDASSYDVTINGTTISF
jgi:hypothetical protein